MDNLTKIYVGVDVSKATLDVHLRPLGQTLRYENSPEGVDSLINFLAKFDLQIITCESSGGYENLMLKMVAKEGFSIAHIDPRRIKGFAESEGVKAKTDASDAKLIAMYAEQKYVMNVPITKVMPT